MGEKQTMVLNYIDTIVASFQSQGYSISDDAINKIKEQYANSPISFEEIKKELDDLARQKREELRKVQEIIKSNAKSITDLPVETKGITLNMQQIDLLSIVMANEQNLKEIIQRINNLTQEQKQIILASNKSLDEIKHDLFYMYQESLTSYIDANFSLDGLGKEREFNKRITFVLNNANLTSEQQEVLVNIIKN